MSGEMGAASTEETLGPLLNVLAQSLDVREIFVQISALARQTVPHDRLMFGLITADGEHYRIVASSEDSQAPPAEIALSPLSQRLLKEDFAIFHHVRTLPGKTWGCAGRMRTASSGADEPFEWHPNWPWARGYESWMRLTVRLRGGVLGFLNFLSRAPDSYTEADVPAARRIADLVALAFAHERLAEEERWRAEAQERAVKLEARVAGLTAELEAAEGHRAIGTSKSWRGVLAQAAKVAPAETTVLLTGESGTGKEGVAHLIHRGSRRAEGPFVALNCAALTRGAFREDLYYRLHVFAIHLPPLRERQEDVLSLLEHFLNQLGPVVIGRPAAGISREAREQFLAYGWPGNVRELRNAVERALILCEGGLINPEHLPWHAESARSAPLPAPHLSPPVAAEPVVGDFPAHAVDLEAMERTLIEGALKQAGQNKSKAAKLLGLSRGKLYTRMERFGLA